MKVLHYCNFFSPLSQTFIYDVIVELDRVGVSDLVVANKLVNLEDRPYADARELPPYQSPVFSNILHKVLDLFGVPGHDWVTLDKVNRLRNLQRIIRAESVDIVHAHFGPQGSMILPAALACGVPLFVSFHGFDAFRLPKESGWMEKLILLFDGATVVTVVSELMKNHLISLGCPAAKLKVIHVGKKIADYRFLNKTAVKIKDFISIGRLTEKKGHVDTVKAFVLLQHKYPELSLKIIGEGELQERLGELIGLNGLEDRIKLLGGLSHYDTVRLLEEADAFILTSKTAADGDQEGIPTVLMEAQALGVPCISTFHSGIPEVIPVANHWMLAEEGNVQQIAERIEELVLCDPDAIAKAMVLGQAKVALEFNLDTEVGKLKELYKSVARTQEV